jgi:hypothetical protein
MNSVMKRIFLVLVFIPAVASADKAATTWDCTKQPSFVTSDNNGVFTLTGKCKQVLISGNKNTVKVEAAAFVALTGNENVVDGQALVSVDASGNKNAVTYKGKKPKWSSSGNGNKISATK